MSVLFVVLPLALLASASAAVAFVWSVRRGQMDDLVTPALRMLIDDEGPKRAPRDERSPRDERASSE